MMRQQTTRILHNTKRRKWNRVLVIQKIQSLPHIHSTWVKQNHNALWKAAVRYFGSWGDAIEAAGYNYEKIKKAGPHGPPPNKGAGGTCSNSMCQNPHHARGFCKRCYAIYMRQEKLKARVHSGITKTTD